MSAPTAICTTSSTSLGGRGQKLMQPKQEETREVHQPEGDQTMPGAADSEAPPAPDIMRMPCGSACPTESLPEKSEVSGWENLPEEAMFAQRLCARPHPVSVHRRPAYMAQLSRQKTPPPRSSSRTLTRGRDNRPCLRYQGGYAQRSIHSRVLLAAMSHWCAGVALQTPHLAQSSVRRLPPALESQECLQIIRLV